MHVAYHIYIQTLWVIISSQEQTTIFKRLLFASFLPRSPSPSHLVIKREGNVSVFQQRVRAQHAIIRLHHRRRDLRARADREAKLALPPIVHAQPLEEEGAEAGPGAPAGGVEDEETLEAGAVVGELADAVEDVVDELLAYGVVSAGVVVGGVLLAADYLLGVVELPVGPGPYLVADGRFKVNVHGARDVLSGPGLGEEGVEGIITTTDSLVGRHLAVGLDSVLEAVELPATVSGLDTGLADVDRQALLGAVFEFVGEFEGYCRGWRGIVEIGGVLWENGED